MEDCTEPHQSAINRKIKANDKLRIIQTNMPEEHRVLIYGDRFRSNMQSLDGEKAALLAARRHFLPLQSRVEKQKNCLERVSKEIETGLQKRLEMLQKWTEVDLELEAGNSKQTQARHEMAILVAEQFAENAKAVNQGIPVVQAHTTGSTSDEATQQTMMQSMSATVSGNSSWRLTRRMRMSKKSSSIWHKECGNWKQGTRQPNQDSRLTVSRAKWWVSDEDFSAGECFPGFRKMDTEGQEATNRSLPNAFTERKRLAKKC